MTAAMARAQSGAASSAALIENHRGRCGHAAICSVVDSCFGGWRELLIRRRAFVAAAAGYHWQMEAATAPGTPARWIRGLLYCGLAAGPVFVTVFLTDGATRKGYRSSRHPVSSLVLGPRGWVQAANFAVTGTLFLAGAAGLRRAGDRALSARAGQALIGAAGAGLIGSAVFTTDSVSGYPPGTPDALVRPSRTGMAHTLAAVPVFAGLPAAALTCSWQSFRTGQRGFGLYCAATATTMLATTALVSAGFNQSRRLVNLAGLFQRASIVTGFGWLTALSARALTRTPATRARRPSA